MSYTRGPYSRFASLPSEERPEIHTARRVDFALGRYAFDSTTGAFESMHATAQRVCITVAEHVTPPHYITPQSLEQTRQDVVRALARLGSAIRDVTVAVTSTTPGVESVAVSFTDAVSGQNLSVQLR